MLHIHVKCMCCYESAVACGSGSWVRKEHIRIAGDLNNRNILEFVVKLMLFATDTGSIELVASAGSSWECAIG